MNPRLKGSRGSWIVLFFAIVTGSEVSLARSIPFPSTWQLLEDHTYAAVLQHLQQHNRDSLLAHIVRDPAVSRYVLIRLLGDDQKLPLARTFAELFRVGANSDLEIPLVEFFAKSDPTTRKRLLSLAETVTDAEWFISSNDYPDRFSREVDAKCEQDLKAAAVEFREMGFVDGEAFCVNTWFRHRGDIERKEKERIAEIERAMRLFQQSGNVRGETRCLVSLAELSRKENNPQRTAELVKLALAKAAADKNWVLQFQLWNWGFFEIDPKIRHKAIADLRIEVEKEPGLKDFRYLLLLSEPAALDEYRTLLASEEDPLQAVRAHRFLSGYFEGSDNLQQAINELDRAIQLSKSLPYDMSAYGGYPHPAVAWMLYERGQKNSQLGKLEQALDDYRQTTRALELEKPSHYSQSLLIFTINEMSSAYRALGEYPLAIQSAQRALKLSQEVASPLWIQMAHWALAAIHSDLGELQIAEQNLEEAARQPNAFFNASPIILAELHLDFQLYEDALRDLEGAEPAMQAYLQMRPHGETRWWWITQKFRLLAHIYLRLGEPERALEAARRVEKQAHPVAEGIVGMVLAELKRYTEAEKYFQERLASTKGKDWLAKEADAHKNLGKIDRIQRRRQVALEHLSKALELYRKLGNRRAEMEVLLELAQVSLDGRDFRAARQHLNNALELAEEAQDQQGIWSARYRLAQAARLSSHPSEAVDHLKLAIEAVEKISGRLSVDLYKSAFLENKIAIYDDLIRLLASSNPAEAFQYAERRRARAFLEAAQKQGGTLLTPADSLRREGYELEARLVGKQKALVQQLSKPEGKRDFGLINSLRRELTEIRSSHTQFLKKLELRQASDGARRNIVVPLSASQVQFEILKNRQALVEYVVTDTDVLAFILTQSSCRSVRLPTSRKDLDHRIRQLQLPFRELREGRVDLLHLAYDLDLAHELYESLFLPLEPYLRGRSDILLVPDDVLNYLPFESLARSRLTRQTNPTAYYAEFRDVDWLLKHYSFRYALSATSLDPKLRNVKAPENSLLAYGLSGVTQSQQDRIVRAVLRRASEDVSHLPSLPPLPEAARESRNIAQIMAGKLTTKVFTEEQATEASFFREAAGSGYLHFAVHSLINHEQPYYSALVLAPGTDSDGLLQTYEISNTRLNSHLVTLSGCETALGKLVRGEGLLGLRRAFLQAGARSILVSLWSVEDSTADFMEQFYKNLRQNFSPTSALRMAKIQYLDESISLDGGKRLSLSHPFFWAPFVLTTTTTD